jgi:hypothetical protein
MMTRDRTDVVPHSFPLSSPHREEPLPSSSPPLDLQAEIRMQASMIYLISLSQVTRIDSCTLQPDLVFRSFVSRILLARTND